MLTAITGINWGDEARAVWWTCSAAIMTSLPVTRRRQRRPHRQKRARQVRTEPGASGILHPSIVCVMGGGMVIDPEHLEKEIADLREQGVEITPDNLKISDRATITMPFHVEQDGLEEARLAKTGAQFGSTKRGIAYTYGDKYMKKTLRMGDLVHMDAGVRKRLETLVESKT